MAAGPALTDHQLNEGRDLAVTTDFRQVLGEAVAKTLGAKNLEMVFPGAQLRTGPVLAHHLAFRIWEAWCWARGSGSSVV